MQKLPQKTNISRIIIRTGLLVGTLDILAAIIQVVIRGGSPVELFQYIASGIFGSEAFSGGWLIALLGLLFHFLIAYSWTIIFFGLYPILRRVFHYPIIIGSLYGIFIWLMMNLVVVPLSEASPAPIYPASAITAMLILIAMIGVPLSFLAGKYHRCANRGPSEQNIKQ